LKTKIEKLSKIETSNLDCKSPDYHEHFSTKSIDESKASVYFTPTEGHLSPQPQLSPLHINYINENMIGCESADEASGLWRAGLMRGSNRTHLTPGQRNSFHLPCDYLEEGDEGISNNFIVPDPLYCEVPLRLPSERFDDVIGTPTSTSMVSLSSTAGDTARRRKRRNHNKERELKSRYLVENEVLLMHEIDTSKGARPKVYRFHHYDHKEPGSSGGL